MRMKTVVLALSLSLIGFTPKFSFADTLQLETATGNTSEIADVKPSATAATMPSPPILTATLPSPIMPSRPNRATKRAAIKVPVM